MLEYKGNGIINVRMLAEKNAKDWIFSAKMWLGIVNKFMQNEKNYVFVQLLPYWLLLH